MYNVYRDHKILERVYLRAVFPNAIAILGGTINVFFDGILVGQRLGDRGIASVNQSLAMYLLLCTAGSLIAAGASAQSASAIGENRMEDGQKAFSLAIELGVVVGGLFCAVGVLLSGALAGLLGSQDTRELVEIYIRITFLGGIFKVLLYIPFYYLRLIGRNVHAAAVMLTMTGFNIVLDVLFMFPLGMGIEGAAWASAIATAAACVLGFFFLFSAKDGFRFRPVMPDTAAVRTMAASGSPVAAGNLFSALRIICLNRIMAAVGGSSLVAVFAITNSLNEFAICIQNGIPQAGSAILGICHGEKDSGSIRQLLRLQLKTGVVSASVFALVLVLFSEKMGLLFGSGLDVGTALWGLAVSQVPGTCNSIMTYYYYAVMKSGMANLITFLRVFGAPVLMAWLLAPRGEWLWLFYLLGELLTAVLWIAVGAVYSRCSRGQTDLYMLDQTSLSEGRCINFTVECNPEDICRASERIAHFCEENDFSQKQSMTISLALEELMVIVSDKSMNHQGVLDVRILRTEDGGILRIRSQGKHYNPLEYAEGDMDYLGVRMIKQMAKHTEYQTTLGLNTLVVVI